MMKIISRTNWALRMALGSAGWLSQGHEENKEFYFEATLYNEHCLCFLGLWVFGAACRGAGGRDGQGALWFPRNPLCLPAI